MRTFTLPGNKKRDYAATFLLLFGGYLLILGLSTQGLLNRYYNGILIMIMINIILAASLNITVGILGQISLGHAGFMSIGAYSAGLFLKSGLMQGLPAYLCALLLGGLAALILGFLVGIPSLRLKGDYLAIITLAFGEIVRVFIEYFDFTGGAQGLSGIPTQKNMPLIYLICVISVLLMYSMMTSRHGRLILAIREDEIAAEASGVNLSRSKIFAFAYSAMFAGIAGAVYAQYMGLLSARQFGTTASIDILVMVVLGGMGSFTGSILSAIALTILPEFLRAIHEYRMILYSLALIIVMLYRPSGLLGREEFQISKILSRLFPVRNNSQGKEKETGTAVAALADDSKNALSDTPFSTTSGPEAGSEAAAATVPAQSPLRDEEPGSLSSESTYSKTASPVSDHAAVVSDKNSAAPLLETQHLAIHFAGLHALQDFSLRLKEGELVGLIGPNGAGKTTVFNILTGQYRQSSGEYRFQDRVITHEKPDELVHMGIARTFQNIRLFKYLTVLQNVQVAMNDKMSYGKIQGVLRLPLFWKEEAEVEKSALELLKIFDLDHVASHRAASLPYGEQRKLEIVRALATRPKVLLLDEPAAGMNPIETEDLMKTIRLIRDRFGLTVLLIEHDMKLVLGICERLLVLDHGQLIAEGAPLEVVRRPEVIEAYLGKEDDQDEAMAAPDFIRSKMLESK